MTLIRRSVTRSLGLGAALTLAIAAAAVAQGQPPDPPHGARHGGGPGSTHGPMHGRPMRGGMHGGMTAMLTRQDAGSAADMDLVHELLDDHRRIRRTVTRLPDGIRTVTESDDPALAGKIQAHVASMSQRLADGREFNLFSDTLPVLFERRDRIVSVVEMTATGAVVVRRSDDPVVVAALQAHADEVSALAQEGMVAMRRGMMARMAMAPTRMRPAGPGGHRPAGSPVPAN